MTTFRFWGDVDPRARTPIGPRAEQPVTESSPWTLYLYEPIDSYGGYWGVSASEFAAALRGIPSDAELVVRLNSPGGEFSEAVAIGNLIRSRAGRTTAIVDGLAASAASYLAVIVEDVTMGVDAQIMIHNAWGITIGDDADHMATAALLGGVCDTLASAYARKAGGELAGWRAAMAAETWYGADEAVAAGLADRVLGQDAAADLDDELAAAAAVLRPVYAYALGHGPRAELPAVVPPSTLPPAPAPATDPAPAPPAADLTIPAGWSGGILNALREATA